MSESLSKQKAMPTVLRVESLSVGYQRGSRMVPVTDAVSFQVVQGEVFALVGESGCGKTATALAIPRLLPKPSGKVLGGHILLGETDLLQLDTKMMCEVRGKRIGVIFQEPSLAIDPVRTIGSQLAECHGYTPAAAEDLLREVGLTDPQRVLRSYGHQLSGGMAQRACIAMAMLGNPELIVADEPTTALDVTVQAAVMEMLLAAVQRRGASLLLITHNLDLVADYADRVGVMYAGRMVECGSVKSVLASPQHPYTQALLKALPRRGVGLQGMEAIAGNVPGPEDFPHGCRFADRCGFAEAACRENPPPLMADEDSPQSTDRDHQWACIRRGGKP